MKNMIRISCGPLPLPGAGQIRGLTGPEMRALVEFARKEAPRHVVELVEKARFITPLSPEWFALLDEKQEQLGVQIHKMLWEQLFG